LAVKREGFADDAALAEHWAKLAFQKKDYGALSNYCKKAGARIRWTRTALYYLGMFTAA